MCSQREYTCRGVHKCFFGKIHFLFRNSVKKEARRFHHFFPFRAEKIYGSKKNLKFLPHFFEKFLKKLRKIIKITCFRPFCNIV